MIGWIILTLLNYYYVPYFILAFEWIVLVIVLSTMTIKHIIKFIKERKQLSRQRIYSLIIITTIFIMTIFRDIPNRIIEKTDWLIFLISEVRLLNK